MSIMDLEWSAAPSGPRNLHSPAPGGGGAGGFYSFNPGQTWTPSLNLYETDLEYLVCVDLAGIDKSKIDVELIDSALTLRGNRTAPTDFDPQCFRDGTARRCRVHVMEIDHGPFERTVELPGDADRQAISARHREGLLWIEIPKLKPPQH